MLQQSLQALLPKDPSTDPSASSSVSGITCQPIDQQQRGMATYGYGIQI